MAKPSEVEGKLDEVSGVIARLRKNCSDAKQIFVNSKASMDLIPTKYAGIITEINGYSSGDRWEENQKSRLAKLTSEFQALNTDVESLITAISESGITEF